jgi:ubiquinone/menaquinone biosynthesis C-methylase UbiE
VRSLDPAQVQPTHQISDLSDRTKRRGFVVALYNVDSAAEEYTEGYAAVSLDGIIRRTRIELVLKLLENVDHGRVLDAGSGPGMLVHALLRSPDHDFTVTALDQSPVMARYCVDNAPEGTQTKVTALVGDLEALPFADGSFDVTLATGSLEYTDARRAIAEISRVTTPTGMAIISMLNPLSPYWLTQWFLRAPARQALNRVEASLSFGSPRSRGAHGTGIRAYRASTIRALLRRVGFDRTQVIYFSPTVLVPPLDRNPQLMRAAHRTSGAMAPSRLTHLLATSYLIVAHRT